jgi:hypothetical protein
MRHTKEALPPLAGFIRPLLGKKTYRQIGVLVAAQTGKPCGPAQIARVVIKIRAIDNAEAQGLAAPFPSPAGKDQVLARSLPRSIHMTRSGAYVTLRAVSLPEVTRAEMRLGANAWSGYERGLKAKGKGKRPLQGQQGAEV